MRNNRLLASANILGLAAALLTFCGCVGYRLGSTLPPGVTSIHVPTFVNRTNEPRLETDTTQAAIREFQRDGTLKIAGERDADAILKVTLVKLMLKPLRYEKDREKATEEYRLTITAELIFERAGSGEVLLRRSVSGDTTFEPRGDLSSAKRAGLPDAAEDLAHDIVESLVEYW